MISSKYVTSSPCEVQRSHEIVDKTTPSVAEDAAQSCTTQPSGTNLGEQVFGGEEVQQGVLRVALFTLDDRRLVPLQTQLSAQTDERDEVPVPTRQ